ncbi:MAG: phosphoenolpyruvate--protein phosphotransferase [Rhodospirillaceae bacterium]
MRLLKGKAVSPGYGDGVAFVVEQAHATVPHYTVDERSVAREQQRFQQALSRAVEEVERLSRRVAQDIGRDHAEIFSAHVALLKSHEFAHRINTRIARDRVNAEQAVEATVGELAALLSQGDDPYLREREQDIRDLGRWVLRQLNPRSAMPLSALQPHSVVVARELLPSDLLHVDRAKIAAIVTELGGEVSHAAILARSLGVPYVTGVAAATAQIQSGVRVLVDGQTGEVWVHPAAPDEAAYALRKERYDVATSRAVEAEDRLCVTTDGEPVSLLANIGCASDVVQVLQHHLDGVGLFRTEMMFLSETEPPTAASQTEQYRAVADALRSRPLVVRTFDFGSDKRPPFLPQHLYSGGALGVRGLRFALTIARDLFREQLRAIVRAASTGDIRIQFPMVIGPSDLLQARRLLEEVCREEGVARPPSVGAMIETPAAVLTIEEILDQVDFVSIGTNDLTQFVLAADRNALELVAYYSVLHPAVLRAIKHVVDAARAMGRTVSVCGEAAAEPATACLLVGLGVRALSMSPASTARVRQNLRRASSADLQRAATTALACHDPADVARIAAGLMREDDNT